MIVGLAILCGLPPLLLPLQILFLNLVTDVFPAFALAMGEGDRGTLNLPPRNPKEQKRDQWLAIVLHGVWSIGSRYEDKKYRRTANAAV